MDYLFRLKNKEFVFECLEIMRKNKLFNDRTIKVLTDKDECHRKFDFQYAILQEVPPLGSIPKEMFMDTTGNRRYYPNDITINGSRFVVCNDWYYENKSGRDNRTAFVNWIKSIVG